MGNDESLYKREDDRKWRERVDYEQITLKTAHQSLGDRLDAIEDKLEEIDDLLRGDPVADSVGVIDDLRGMRKELSKLNSAIFMDSTGKRGIAHDVDYLMDRKRDKETVTGYKWGFWGLIAAAVIGAVAIFVTNKDQILKWLPSPKLSPFEQMIDRAAHPKGKHRHYTIHEPADEENSQ